MFVQDGRAAPVLAPVVVEGTGAVFGAEGGVGDAPPHGAAVGGHQAAVGLTPEQRKNIEWSRDVKSLRHEIN